MAEFREISPYEITENTFKLLNKDWALVTVKNGEKENPMTISWGGVGIMWNKPVAFTFIRPQRYTFSPLENQEFYTINFFDEYYRDALKFCGSKSGRDFDKTAETGLTPCYNEKAPYYKEAKLVLVCKKMYAQNLNEESIVDTDAVASSYNGDDFHKMYISEIVKVLIK